MGFIQNTKHIFAAATLKFTEIRQLSSVSTARLQSDCLAISMPWKCFCLRASGQWVKRLPDVVSALNNEVTSLIGKKPAATIKEKAVSSKPSTKYSRPVGLDEKKLPPLINVRYLYQPGELEGRTKRATDPIWSLKVYQVVENKTKPNDPVVYYLSEGPKRGFVCEELLVVLPNRQLPPA